MELNRGASVFTRDGHKVGRTDRVVVEPKTNVVTHIVVRKGHLFSKDKLVPVEVIASGQGERIVLQMDRDQLEQLPDFAETHHVLLDKKEVGREPVSGPIGMGAPPLYWCVPYSGAAYVAETNLNIPEGAIAVKEGAKIITRDDQYIGNVEQVLTNYGAGHVMHFVVARGLLQKEKKLIPVTWIDHLGEDELHLAVGSHTVENLPAIEQAR